MKPVKMSTALLAGASVMAMAWQASAQTEKPSGAKDDAQVVVVTGSRVVRNGNNMPTPVTVITTEALKDVRPGNLVEALSDMPVFNGSKGQATNTGTGGAAGSPASSQNAVNAVNLRQLGVQRSLVLYDGHRVNPSSPDGTVDLDTIPQMLLQRVDVVTGGASAVYGSDAITGVVNFVTDTHFNGLKVEGSAGRSTYGDADTAEGGLAFGKSLFGGRGHVMGSFEAREQAPITSAFTRPFGKYVWTLQGNGASIPYFQASGARDASMTFGGRVNTTALGDSQFTTGGYIVPFVHGTNPFGSLASSASCKSCEIGGDGGYVVGQLRAGLDMKQAYGRFDYDFTDTLHGFVSLADTYNRSIATGFYNYNSTYAIGADNAYLLPAYKTALGAATSFTLGKIWADIPRPQLESRSNDAYLNTGLSGRLGNYKWDIGLSQGASTFKVTQRNALDNGRLYASLDSVVSGGAPVCRAALTNTAYAGCVPLDPFGTNTVTQANRAYFLTNLSYETKIGATDLNAAITGSPISTWAGPVDIALTGEHRKLTYEIDSATPAPGTAANCTGVSYNCNAKTAVYSVLVASVPQVSQTVDEAAVEAEVPLARDMAFAKSLSLNTAYRYARYDRAGAATTWKIGGTWDLNDMLTFRATRSKDFRAPTLDENFRALSYTAPTRGFPDTLATSPSSVAHLNPNAAVLNGGNPDLKPETGYTWTYGVVFRPTSRLSIAVDAFNIRVDNAIFLVQGNTPVYQNACYAGGGTDAAHRGSSQYCQLIIRDSTGDVTEWKQTFINLAQLDTNGVDFEVNYRAELFARPLAVRLLGTYQPHLIYKQPGIVNIDYAGSSFGTNGLQANPVWRWTAFANYKPTQNLNISVEERWREKLPKVDGNPTVLYGGQPVKAVAYTSLNAAYTLPSKNLELYLNIQNLFNQQPPQAGFWGNPNPGQFGEVAFGDDVIGRFFTVGFRYRR